MDRRRPWVQRAAHGIADAYYLAMRVILKHLTIDHAKRPYRHQADTSRRVAPTPGSAAYNARLVA